MSTIQTTCNKCFNIEGNPILLQAKWVCPFKRFHMKCLNFLFTDTINFKNFSFYL